VAYLNCPRCGLSFRVQALDLVMEKCPRCLAKAGRVTRLLVSEAPKILSRGSLRGDMIDVRPGALERDGASSPPPSTAPGGATPEPAV
jgi:hypothetical protein